MIDPAVDPRLCDREILQFQIRPVHQLVHAGRQDIYDLHDTVDQSRYDHPEYTRYDDKQNCQRHHGSHSFGDGKRFREFPFSAIHQIIDASNREIIDRAQQICHHQAVDKRRQDSGYDSYQFLHSSKSIYSKKNQNTAQDDQECGQSPFYIFFF